MKKIFKKCFDITYNEKKFTIFVDENHRYTFLEKDTDGKYLYPTLEDYKALNKIYNEHDSFVIYNAKQYTFKEKVKVGALTLAVTVALSACGNNQDKPLETTSWTVETTTENESEKVIVTQAEPKPSQIRINSLDEFNEIFKIPPVSIEDITSAIENNNNLDAQFKKLSHDIATAIYENEPTADLRIYYSNIQTLETEVMSEEAYQEKFQDHSQARYEIKENKIYYKIGSSETDFIHELSHTTYWFYREIDGKIYYRIDDYTYALNEAFNNKIVEYVIPPNSYKNIGFVLEYLFAFVDYDFNSYNSEGPIYLLNDLKEKYPDIDVFYINDCLNAMKNNIIREGKIVKIEDSEDLVATLMTLGNKKISESGLDTEISLYDEIKGFIWDGENFYPYIEQNGFEATVIEDGAKKEKSFFAYMNFKVDSNSLTLLKLLLRNEYIKNPDIVIDSNFWNRYAVENNFINPEQVFKTTLFLDGESLAEERLTRLRIQVGELETGEIGFIISSYSPEKIIYQSSGNLKNISNYVFFTDYYSVDMSNIEKLELESILNEEYLKQIMKQKELFKNLFITEGNIEIEPLLNLYITDESGVEKYFYLNRYYFDEENIYLKEILQYYGLLEPSKTEYYYTTQEIDELLNSYVEEQKAQSQDKKTL